MATIVASFAAFGWKWGADSSKELLLRKLHPEADENSLALCFSVIALLIASVVSVVVSLVIGLVSSESVSLTTSLITIYGMNFTAPMIAVFGGITTHAIGGVAWRKANFATKNLGINAISYTIPILSLIWLFWLTDAGVERWDYLIIGAVAIITANLLINFEAEIRLGFKALILALGTCGVIVYLRDGVFEFLGVEKWNWTDSGYFESITLAATVFTLLVAFRVARLSGRTTDEDNRTFSIYRKLDLLARRGVINHEVCHCILQIDGAGNDVSGEKEAYVRARLLIADVDPAPLNEVDSQLLTDAESQLDALARSKQVDIHLGEIFALGIFAAITIGLALLSRPPQLGDWTRLLVDLFAMLISAVVVFLLFHIQDLQRERDEQKLEPLVRPALYRHYLVRFHDIERRLPDQLLSFIVGTAIVLTYAGLLAHKLLGWFG